MRTRLRKSWQCKCGPTSGSGSSSDIHYRRQFRPASSANFSQVWHQDLLKRRGWKFSPGFAAICCQTWPRCSNMLANCPLGSPASFMRVRAMLRDDFKVFYFSVNLVLKVIMQVKTGVKIKKELACHCSPTQLERIPNPVFLPRRPSHAHRAIHVFLRSSGSVQGCLGECLGAAAPREKFLERVLLFRRLDSQRPPPERRYDHSNTERGGKHQNFRAGFPGVEPGNRPRDPLGSTGRPPDVNLHQKSAAGTNSKAISWWAGGWMF